MGMPDSISMLDSWRFWNAPGNKSFLIQKIGHEPTSSQDWLNSVHGYCPFCDGYGWFDLQGGRTIYCICRFLRQLEWSHALQQEFGTPVPPTGNLETLQPRLLTKPEHRENLAAIVNDVETWLNTLDRWIFIHGGVGCGKTTMLYGLKNILKDMAFYITMTDWQDQLFGYLNKDSEEDNPLERMTDALRAAPVLLLDDLGMEYGKSQWTVQKVTAVINFRYANADKLPVVVSSNYTPEDLRASPDLAVRRLADRLLDRQHTQILHLMAPSFRQPAQIG